LTRFGAVSATRLTAQFLLRVTDSARAPPEELVNPASGFHPLRGRLRGVEPTSLTPPLPSHLGLSLGHARFSFVHRCTPALSMNCRHHSRKLPSAYQILSTRLFTFRPFHYCPKSVEKPTTTTTFAFSGRLSKPDGPPRKRRLWISFQPVCREKLQREAQNGPCATVKHINPRDSGHIGFPARKAEG